MQCWRGTGQCEPKMLAKPAANGQLEQSRDQSRDSALLIPILQPMKPARNLEKWIKKSHVSWLALMCNGTASTAAARLFCLH